MTLKQRMNIYLSECSLHAEVLDEALAEAHAWLPLSPESEVGKEMLRVLDQIAYRFGKLQDSMEGKVLPLILEMTEDLFCFSWNWTMLGLNKRHSNSGAWYDQETKAVQSREKNIDITRAFG